MINKHFFKTLLLFAGMLAIGLAGIILVGYFDQSGGQEAGTVNNSNTETQFAK